MKNVPGSFFCGFIHAFYLFEGLKRVKKELRSEGGKSAALVVELD